MGKAGKWLRRLLGLHNTDSDHRHAHKPPPKNKWSFAISKKETDRYRSRNDVVRAAEDENEASKRAIAVAAAATAAVAEAAVAAAQAAEDLAHLTSSGWGISAAACVSEAGARYGSRREWAAVAIQSHFRAYLSRRALRALKALVKIQALVKGHLVRKQTAYAMRRLRALVRAQMRARAGRALMISDSPQSSTKSSHFNYLGPETPEKFEHAIRSRSMKHDHTPILKRNGSKPSSRLHHEAEKAHSPFYSTHLSLASDQICQRYSASNNSTARQAIRSLSYGEAQSFCPLIFAEDVDQSAFCTADNSPAASSRGGSSKRGAFTPTKSDGCLSSYSDYPNYMSYTESSKAKVRSLSAPKQRSQYERSNSMKRYSVHGYGDSRPTQRVSALHGNFANSAYYFA